MRDTKVILTIPGSGSKKFFEQNEGEAVLYGVKDFAFIKRKRTDEELEKLKVEWEKEPHLMSGEGYINQIRNQMIITPNPEFPGNYMEYIKENIGKVDYILVENKKEIRNALRENKITYIAIFPKKYLKGEWFYRCYMNGYPEIFYKHMSENWDKTIDELEYECEKYNIENYRLDRNEYIKDAIRKMKLYPSTSLQRKLLLTKIALIKMIHQYMGTTMLEGKKHYDNYCMSAGEAACCALGINDVVSAEELCNLEERMYRELWEIDNPGQPYDGYLASDSKGILY